MSAVLEWLVALPGMLVLAVLAWVIATARKNVGLVDIVWPLFILLAALTHLAMQDSPSPRAWLVVAITALWAMRLAVHLAVRNWNAKEDHRYQEIRRRNDPGFWWKSLYLVFALQAVLALIVATAPFAVISAPAAAIGWLEILGAAVALGGLTFEAIADWQLTRFLASAHHGKVMDQGLWRYSRHPNYFGEFCVWWGIFLIALAGGGWWSIVSPLLMSVLLLRVSGVTLLEKDIGHRRPGYAAYVQRTPAFFPGPPRQSR